MVNPNSNSLNPLGNLFNLPGPSVLTDIIGLGIKKSISFTYLAHNKGTKNYTVNNLLYIHFIF